MSFCRPAAPDPEQLQLPAGSLPLPASPPGCLQDVGVGLKIQVRPGTASELNELWFSTQDTFQVCLLHADVAGNKRRTLAAA